MTKHRKDPVLKSLEPLKGRVFTLRRWEKVEPEWTHDHCRGCRAHICDEDDDDIHEAYVTVNASDDEDWVCPNCFDLWRLVLNFQTKRP